MRSLRLLLALAALSAVFFAADAGAKNHSGFHGIKRTYEHYYWKAAHRVGRAQVGRDIVRRGLHTKHGDRPATRKHIARSIRTFKRWLAPPPAAAVRGDQISASPAYAGGRYAIPTVIVMCESGGDYTKRNYGGSGAGGAYQMMPSTFHAYGGVGDPATAPPAMQDQVAARLYAAEGTGPWRASESCWG